MLNQNNNTTLSGIYLVGLGPGDPGLVTRKAWQLLENCVEIYLRTSQHPVVDHLPERLIVNTFDDLYEKSDTFDEVYDTIVDKIIQLGCNPQGVVYAVPGHPLVAESTCLEIIRRAGESGIPVHIIDGLSFLEVVFAALKQDPLPQSVICDALDLARKHVPPFPVGIPAMIAQLHSRAIASDVKLTLMTNYPDEHPVSLVHAAGTPLEQVEHLKLFEIDRSSSIGLMTVLFVPPLDLRMTFEAFQEIIAHLRAPDGCPWDRKQDHQTLRSYLLEETYETLDAIDHDDPVTMMEEFGDLLLQIVLHAQIASEYGEFTMGDILAHVHKKIVFRHPHVFGEVKADDAQTVLVNWERLKAEERAENGKSDSMLLDGIPVTLPALSQANEYLKRVARVGFDWQDIQDVILKLDEELIEARSAQTPSERQDEVGDLLLAVANLARWYEVDPESALRQANQRFRQRFGYIEKQTRDSGRSLQDLSLDELLDLWENAKQSKNE